MRLEGRIFDLGSKLQNEDHFAAASRIDETQEEVLREAETNVGRLHGPLDAPISDDR